MQRDTGRSCFYRPMSWLFESDSYVGKEARLPSKAQIILEDNTVIHGTSFGDNSSCSGEFVFSTAMVGYPEALTDPSYKGQILVFTYPLIGNYGVPEMKLDEYGLPYGFESERIQASGLVVSSYSSTYSHYNAKRSLADWLKSESIPALANIDTRALTKKLRNYGSMLGKIVVTSEPAKLTDPNASDLVSLVSTKEVVRIESQVNTNGTPKPTVVLLDCGCKANIIRSLLMRGINVLKVPYNYYFMNLDFDGLLISNGPGDPKMYSSTIRNVEHSLAVGKPILGICLGHQILACAAGADTYKLKYGHRSHNQPCLELTRSANGQPPEYGSCVITSQNHGYAVKEDALPSEWEVWYRNANDNTVEGIRHRSKPFSSVQFHPEATPGPVDTRGIFDSFAQQVKNSVAG